MSFIEEIKQRAKQDIKTIILPEAQDIRTLKATEQVLKEGYAKIILVGNKEEIEEKALENKIDISGALIIEPTNSEKYEEYVNLLFELRKQKGMSLEKAKKYLEEKGYADHVIELEESSATVQLAAEALGVEPGMIAKTMSFLTEDGPILILTEGTAKIANRKYKDYFHEKAKRIPFDEAEDYIGHAPGGVCPFGIKDGVKVYLDGSLKRYDTVYPAAGNDHSAVKLTIVELEEVAGASGWIDVCK